MTEKEEQWEHSIKSQVCIHQRPSTDFSGYFVTVSAPRVNINRETGTLRIREYMEEEGELLL
jgi:hypothetical protein